MESFTWQMLPKIIFGPGSGEKAGKGARALAALMLPFYRYLASRNPKPYLRWGRTILGIIEGSQEERLEKEDAQR